MYFVSIFNSYYFPSLDHFDNTSLYDNQFFFYKLEYRIGQKETNKITPGPNSPWVSSKPEDLGLGPKIYNPKNLQPE